ncbi:MAG: trehalose-6-phosphate synthase [Actinomycetota bacterium]|nr:trehalose-6-phosphate synthase [Actinomycetota bacterium]MDH5225686.1 trehalose-6-phosphate synthase [Actinomycetota bacterium]MDH5313419.1 trehalose-6-phosphate synthase [Actinomycetota bacterium]
MSPNGTGVGSAIESSIVVASNRGPVSFDRGERGRLTPRRGTGGLVTALSGVFYRDDTSWVSAAMTEGDRAVALKGRAVTTDSNQRMRYVVIPPERYDGYYNEVSNRILWMAHHNLWDIPRSPMFDDATMESWDDFVEANRIFARALARQAGNDPVYLIQDYHLSLVPGMLRTLVPDAKIVHFSHTPFAGATYLAVLPDTMRTAILRGLAGADVLGFQSKQWAENYLLSARGLPELRVLRGGRLDVDGRTAAVRSFPVAVSAEPLRETANRPEADEVRSELREWAGDSKIMLRVDRLEPSKNILRGFLAFELFLRRNPSWVGTVRFLCLLSPSREDVPEYQNYGEECLAVAERINDEFRTKSWQPIEIRVQEDYAFAVAAYDLYDVLLVNPTYDGMNLVAMEGPLVNRRDGVLVLSRNAGAFTRLGRQSLGVNPFDLAETAEAMREGLEMPEEERARRARGMSRTVSAHTPANWLADQLEAVDQVRPPRRRR